MIRRLATLLLLLLLALPALARAETHRLAIVVGNNAGDGKIAPLRFAEADASKVARALVEVGQVYPDDLFVLQGHGVADLRAVFDEAKRRIGELHKTPDNRVVLLFYYSGHSDGEALELGRDRLPFGELKKALSNSGAEVRMSIVDACRSGSAIQPKGGKAAPAFQLRLADDLATSGDAIMASSAADEVALESPELQGSYFTSALVSGLRGAADTSGDKQVTLAEAYRYAYDHTVSSTALTLEGAQHPVYDFRLTGQGELVLAALDRPRAALLLPEGLERAMVIDVAHDQVVAELLPGAARFLAVAPGAYAVRGFTKGKVLGTRVELAQGETRELKLTELNVVAAPKVARKGGGPDLTTEADDGATRVDVSLGVTSGVTNDLGPRGALRAAFEPKLVDGLAIAGELAYGRGGGVNETAVHARVGYQLQLRPGSGVRIGVGAEAGPAIVTQTITSTGASSSAIGFTLGPRATIAVAMFDRTELVVEGGVPFEHIAVDQSSTWVALPTVTAGVAFGL